MTQKKNTTEYVNNEQFYLEMVRYKRMVEEAKAQGLPKPRVPEYIGACILLIAQRLTNNRSFIGYSDHYKDEMVCDGVENCILYIDNYDPDKTNNPFAYFTQIIWYAFIRRLQKEKRQQYIKAKNLQMFALHESLSEDISIEKIMPNDAMNDLIVSFERDEKSKKNKKNAKKKGPLDDIVERIVDE